MQTFRLLEKQQQFCVTIATKVFDGFNVQMLLMSFLVHCSADAGRPLCQSCAFGLCSPKLTTVESIVRLFIHCANFWVEFIHEHLT